MSPEPPIPAAQYVRMSTEHQQYSIANQTAIIQQYAKEHGFQIVRTYADEGKSGIVLQNRAGLMALLDDVLTRRATYGAILVYDVSRWGRFQDSDESAFYEFICKHSGAPVHYCAELFGNGGSLHDSLLKTLKRTMAAEFSRELGVKTSQGKRRLAQLGFWTGAIAGYGYRRALIDEGGNIRKVLRHGERKYLMTHRVRLVLGPKREGECVQRIFGMFLKNKNAAEITRWLNDNGVPFTQGKSWNASTLLSMLRNPKYIGWNVVGMVSRRLRAPAVDVHDPQKWAMNIGAFPALVDQKTYDRVQQEMRTRGLQPTDDECVAKTRQMLSRRGKLTESILQQYHKRYGIPTAANLAIRFGSTRRLYELAGYQPPLRWAKGAANTVKTRGQMEQLALQIKAEFPDHVKLFKMPPQTRPLLKIDDQIVVSLLPCPARPSSGPICWLFRPVVQEMMNITLLCMLNRERNGFQLFYLMPRIERECSQITIRENNRFLAAGVKLGSLKELYVEVLRMVQRNVGNFMRPSE
jgi:DNA invertase Pin-like site-specific DNA recombinase